MKYSSKRSDFLSFYAYLCMSLMIFACLDLHTKVSEKYDMAKS